MRSPACAETFALNMPPKLDELNLIRRKHKLVCTSRRVTFKILEQILEIDEWLMAQVESENR